MLPLLKSEVRRLLRIVLGRMLKPDIIKQTEENFQSLDLDDTTLQLRDEELGIGHKTWACMAEQEDFLNSTVKNLME